MSIADDVFNIFQRRGSGAYFGDRVSMTEHALQAAYFAREESAPPTLIVAALLHDIGHLVGSHRGGSSGTSDTRKSSRMRLS